MSSAPKQDVDRFETKALAAGGLDVSDVPPRYRSSYFLQIWSNGYAAGYYAYLWTKMLDDDAFHWFVTHGGTTRENGERFRDLILSRGHTENYGEMFHAFYRTDPEIEPMLQRRGLAPGGDRRKGDRRKRRRRSGKAEAFAYTFCRLCGKYLTHRRGFPTRRNAAFLALSRLRFTSFER